MLAGQSHGVAALEAWGPFVVTARPAALRAAARLAVALTIGLVGIGLPPSAHADPVVSPVPGRTAGALDGEVYALAKVGTTVVAGGSFTSARSWGSTTAVPRSRILAFDATNGQLVDGFAPVLNGTVYALVPGPAPNTVLAAGTFKRMDDKSVKRVIMIDVTNGKRITSFKAPAINGRINSLAVQGNRVYVGGNFTKVAGVAHAGFASLDYTTGAYDPFVSVQASIRHNDSGSGAQSAVGVTELDVTPDGSRVVAVGNFKRVDGLSRDQVVVLDTSGAQAVVSPTWATSRFSPYCAKNAFDSWVRDVSFSPDGSFFVVTTTGGPYAGTLCDSASRWETYATGTSLEPTWVDWSGGDTLWGVEVTDNVVYIGGHMRWMNNINGRDSAGQGAVARPGIAALSVQNGLPLDWNPGRHTRGEAAYVFLAADDGVYFGSDTEYVGNFEYRRPRIGFFPYLGGHEIAPDNRAALPADIMVGSPGSSGDSLAVQSFDGATVGARSTLGSTGVAWGSTRGAFWIGGKVFYGNNDGWLYSRTYSKGVFGPAVKLDPYHDPAWNGVATGSGSSTYTGVVPSLFGSFNSSITGLAYSNGRVYYSTAGSSTLSYRYFSADSGIVGSEVFNASNGISWSDANIAFTSGDQLYFVSRSTGQLKRIALVNNLPTGTATVVDASRDWRGRSVFLAPQNVNAAPVADFTATCADTSCDFDASGSVDPDGTIAGYAWTFGDGATANGPTPHHDYASGGSRSVTLTVTDNEGATATVTRTVVSQTPAVSTIAFVDAATSAATSTGTTASVTVPASVQAGDTLVLYAGVSVLDPGLTGPAGWTQVGAETASGMSSTVWMRTATASSAGSSVDLGFDTAAKSALTLVAYRNASAVLVPGAIASATDSNVSSHVAPQVTAPSGAWVLSYWSDKSSWVTGSATPADQQTRAVALGGGSGRVTSAMVDSGARVALPGVAGGATAESQGDRPSTRSISWTIALSPSP